MMLSLLLLLAAPQLAAGGAAKWPGSWSRPPIAVPSSKTVDGPLLGDGEVGAVLGVDAPTGALSAYLSANSFWVLMNTTYGELGRSHRAGIGGVTLLPLNATSPASPVRARYTLGQDMADGSVSFALWPSDAPPPPPPSVKGCSLLGRWLTRSGMLVVSKDVSGSGFFIRNPDPACKPAPGPCGEGWRNATATVSTATGAIALDYHRFEKAGCDAYPTSKQIHCYNISSAGCDCVVTGRFISDCDHALMSDTGAWRRQGSAPPPPPAPPAPAPPPSGTPLLRGMMLMSQTAASSGEAAASTIVMDLQAGAAPIGMSLSAWAFPTCSLELPACNTASGGITADGAAWASRTLPGTARQIKGVVVLRADKAAASSAGSKQDAALNLTLAAGESATVLITVLTSVTTNDSPPLAMALSASKSALATKGAEIKAEATAFWAAFWAKSSVSLPSQPVLERFWYCSQYLMAMASRAGRVAPGLWGPSSRKIRVSFFAARTLNSTAQSRVTRYRCGKIT